MKKLIALLLAVTMLLSMTACGGSAEPVETAPATTEAPTTAPTEAPTEEPTTAPTEAPRVIPTDFETVDPATLPEPVPVEAQLQSEATQTVTLGSLEEYEDLLWSLGFEEVRLVGTHKSMAQVTDNEAAPMNVEADSYCEPVSLTYNNAAFRFDFVYCQQIPDGELVKEEGWCMYGTKSTTLANVSAITEEQYIQTGGVIMQTIEINTDGSQSAEGVLATFDFGSVDWEGAMAQGGEKITTPNYEEEPISFIPRDDASVRVNVQTVYYPITGNLYNYMCDPASEGMTTTGITLDGNFGFVSTGTSYRNVGLAAKTMCFHYLFPAEDAAE